MTIPDAAIEAAAKALFGAEQCDRRQMLELDHNWHSRLNERDQDEYRDIARAAIEAAMPAIREALAQEIEAELPRYYAIPHFGISVSPAGGVRRAASIVRGGAA